MTFISSEQYFSPKIVKFMNLRKTFLSRRFFKNNFHSLNELSSDPFVNAY